ncbi:MAG: hypothetical protein LBF66_01925 [Holosporales bacterium]|jgi:hypothetical protein|nr:hypothetical protein [Holosporales bacterium]
MATFRSVLVLCATAAGVTVYTLEWIRSYKRYEFLVKGEVCIAYDHKEEALKVIDAKGCVTIPLTKTMEQEMRERLKSELTKEVKRGLLQGPKDADGEE